MSSNSVCNHTRDKQIGLPLCGRPILLSLVWLQTELDSTQSLVTITNHNGNTSNNDDVINNNGDSNNRDSIKDSIWQLSFELSRSMFKLSALKGYKLFKFFFYMNLSSWKLLN